MRLASRPPASAIRRARMRCTIASGAANSARASIAPSAPSLGLDFGRQMRQRVFGLSRAPRKADERLGVQALLVEPGEKGAQAGAGEARIGVGRVVDGGARAPRRRR